MADANPYAFLLHKAILERMDIGKAQDAIPRDSPQAGMGPTRKVYVATHKLPLKLNDIFGGRIIPHGVGEEADLFYDTPTEAGKETRYSFPNPTYHWAVVVGDFEHELNCEPSMEIVYQNRHFHPLPVNISGKGWTQIEGRDHTLWTTYEVGTTGHNDRSIQEHGVSFDPAIASQLTPRKENELSKTCTRQIPCSTASGTTIAKSS
jgi:hypothetical protein